MDTLRIGANESLQIEARPGEKLPHLSPGEVVRARVVEIMPGGDALLRVKGSLIQAKSDLQLAQDTMVLFRVTEVKGEKGAQQIRFQMIETLPEAKLQGGPAGAGFAAVRELVRELTTLLTVKGQRPADFSAAIERLLKTLPDDAGNLPKDLRAQILTILRTSLRNAEQNIQNRLNLVLSDPWLKDLPEWLESLAVLDGLFAGVDKMPDVPFKSLLGNTGVALEAKMRALAGSLAEDAANVPEEGGSVSEAPVSPNAALLGADLKGKLLELRLRILGSTEQGETDAKHLAARGGHAKDAGAAQTRALEVLDGLLQDIETFQLLSKVTDSFYTFLPLVWEGLREGEIAFKKSRGGSQERSYYCLVQLDFEQLGKLTILALKQDQDFFISFETENDALRNVLKQNVPELEKMFEESGLSLKAADFHGTKEKHLAPFEQLESFENILSVKI